MLEFDFLIVQVIKIEMKTLFSQHFNLCQRSMTCFIFGNIKFAKLLLNIKYFLKKMNIAMFFCKIKRNVEPCYILLWKTT